MTKGHFSSFSQSKKNAAWNIRRKLHVTLQKTPMTFSTRQQYEHFENSSKNTWSFHENKISTILYILAILNVQRNFIYKGQTGPADIGDYKAIRNIVLTRRLRTCFLYQRRSSPFVHCFIYLQPPLPCVSKFAEDLLLVICQLTSPVWSGLGSIHHVLLYSTNKHSPWHSLAMLPLFLLHYHRIHITPWANSDQASHHELILWFCR